MARPVIGETVTILRAGEPTQDRYGNDIPGEDVPEDVDGVAVAPRYDAEARQNGRTGVIVGFTLLLPPGTNLDAVDRIVVRGKLHEIEGEPGDWTNPFTNTDRGVEAATRRVEG